MGAVASLLGVVAAGCSGEVMDEATAGNGEIGSVAQALNGTAPSAVAGAADMSNGTGREFAASCVLSIGGVDQMLVAGGVTSGGTYLRDALLYNPASPSWTATDSFGTLGTDERAFAKMIKIPGQNKCMLIGGDKGGASFTSTFIYDPAQSPGSKWSAGPALAEARSKFAIHECADDSILIVGGVSSTTRRHSVEVLDSALASWAKTDNVLIDAAQDLAIAADYSIFNLDQANPEPNQFFISGGFTGAAESDQIVLLKTDENCENLVATQFTDGSDNGSGLVKTVSGNDVAHGLSGHVVLPTKADTFVVTAGRNGFTAHTIGRAYTVNWSGTPTITSYGSDVLNFLSNGAYLPALVRVPSASNNDGFWIIGGTDASNNGNGVRSGMGLTTDKVFEVQDTFRDTYTNMSAALSDSLNDGSRFAAVAEYLPSEAEASLAAGVRVTAGPTNVDELDVEAIQP